MDNSIKSKLNYVKNNEEEVLAVIQKSLLDNLINQNYAISKKKLDSGKIDKVGEGLHEQLKNKKSDLLKSIKTLIKAGENVPIKFNGKKHLYNGVETNVDATITTVEHLISSLAPAVTKLKQHKKIQNLKSKFDKKKEKINTQQINMLAVRGRGWTEKIAMQFSRGSRMKLKFESARRKSLDATGKLDNVKFVHHLMKSFNRSLSLRGLGAIKGTFGYNSLTQSIGKKRAANAFGNQNFANTMTQGQKNKFDNYIKTAINSLESKKSGLNKENAKQRAQKKEIQMYIDEIKQSQEQMNSQKLEVQLHNTQGNNTQGNNTQGNNTQGNNTVNIVLSGTRQVA